MSDLIVVRYRISVDLLVKVKETKVLTAPHQAMLANRLGTYSRTGAVEGLEDRIEVIFDERFRNQHTHTHDATQGRCRACLTASQDDLGPI